jgi:hypothetical protein
VVTRQQALSVELSVGGTLWGHLGDLKELRIHIFVAMANELYPDERTDHVDGMRFSDRYSSID